MLARFGTLSFLAFAVLSACAEGAPAAPADEKMADITLGQTPAMCHNGMLEKGELCDCRPETSTMCEAPSNVTCESLMLGVGPVFCDAQTCMLVTSMCSLGKPGGGAGASGGQAGRGP
ncbi:MAG TPA: hypothetical protein VJR89_13965 [Polyangiales bacterium]|nr:hypothetical protein [Polyangiales bacterium]